MAGAGPALLEQTFHEKTMRLISILTAGVLAVLLPQSGFGESVSDSFNDTTRINTAASSGYELVRGTLRSSGGVDRGTGADGPCSVSGDLNLSSNSCVGRSHADAVAFRVTAPVAANQATIPLELAPIGLTDGDEVLIINLLNPAGDGAIVGQHETRRILSISNNTLTLDANLTHAYDGTTSRIMVQRVPNYTSVSVSAGATLSANGFNGSLGGVFFIRVHDAVTMMEHGSIHMSGRGYRGGMGPPPPPPLASWNGGFRGEGPTTIDKSLRTYTQSHGSGGGGDAEECAVGQGGGGGGHGSPGANGGAQWLTCNNGTKKWSFGENRAEGGVAIGTPDLANLLMGPGGGSGGVDGNDPDWGGGGGAGGGIIVIAAQSVAVHGGIHSNGGPGSLGISETGGGGGGAGGSILLQAYSLSLDSNRVTASAGAGGGSQHTPGNAGGAGGVGRIAVRSFLPPSGSTSPSAFLQTLSYSPATVTSTNLLAGTG
ncbi:MAG TPA: hypothetical protein VF815_17575, partial [Myxococcaceae bacterium]